MGSEISKPSENDALNLIRCQRFQELPQRKDHHVSHLAQNIPKVKPSSMTGHSYPMVAIIKATSPLPQKQAALVSALHGLAQKFPLKNTKYRTRMQWRHDLTPLVLPQASVWWGCGENGALLVEWRVWLLWKTLAVPQKAKALSWDPTNPSQINSMTWKHLPTQKTCTWTLTAFNITSKREKQSKCPSPGKSKKWCGHTMIIQPQDKVLLLQSHEQWKQGVEDAGHKGHILSGFT